MPKPGLFLRVYNFATVSGRNASDRPNVKSLQILSTKKCIKLACRLEIGKNPHCLSSVLFGLQNIRVRSVRVLSSYGKIKVRFRFGSLCRVFGSVQCGN